jgi:hypothetical protein
MTGSKCIHDLVPDTSLQPPNEAIVTAVRGPSCPEGRAMAHLSGGPKDAFEHATIIYPPNAARLIGQHRLDKTPRLSCTLKGACGSAF